jgi:hypothetical protein
MFSVSRLVVGLMALVLPFGTERLKRPKLEIQPQRL